MKKHVVLAQILVLFSPLCLGARNSDPFPFDSGQLSGWWVENYDTHAACGPDNPRTQLTIDPTGSRLEMRMDRTMDTALGAIDRLEATILKATSRTLVIQYDGETRRKSNGQPMEWELAIVAPGVYRWRETDWPPGEVNVVVGIRCSQ